MLRKIDSITMKFKRVIGVEERAIRTAGIEVARSAREAVRVLRIAIFLHSAEDFSSVLRLYGIEDSP